MPLSVFCVLFLQKIGGGCGALTKEANNLSDAQNSLSLSTPNIPQDCAGEPEVSLTNGTSGMKEELSSDRSREQKESKIEAHNSFSNGETPVPVISKSIAQAEGVSVVSSTAADE